jgi:hypothetical protein
VPAESSSADGPEPASEVIAQDAQELPIDLDE